jgi:hypothetical protein
MWATNNNVHVSLLADAWQDPAAWGIALADLARHVANAYHQKSGLDREKTVERVVSLLLAELGSPTDKPRGEIVR